MAWRDVHGMHGTRICGVRCARVCYLISSHAVEVKNEYDDAAACINNECMSVCVYIYRCVVSIT